MFPWKSKNILDVIFPSIVDDLSAFSEGVTLLSDIWFVYGWFRVLLVGDLVVGYFQNICVMAFALREGEEFYDGCGLRDYVRLQLQNIHAMNINIMNRNVIKKSLEHF